MAIAAHIGICPHGITDAVCVRCTLGDWKCREVMLIGDTIWFSVELLRQMSDEPNPVLVRVKDIQTEMAGTKMIVLERV